MNEKIRRAPDKKQKAIVWFLLKSNSPSHIQKVLAQVRSTERYILFNQYLKDHERIELMKNQSKMKLLFKGYVQHTVAQIIKFDKIFNRFSNFLGVNRPKPAKYFLDFSYTGMYPRLPYLLEDTRQYILKNKSIPPSILKIHDMLLLELGTAEQQFEAYQKNQPILINLNLYEHAVTIILYRDFIIIGNRGQYGRLDKGSMYGSLIFKLNAKTQVTLDLIKELKDTHFNKKSYFRLLTRLISVNPFWLFLSKGIGQKRGTCVISSPKAAIKAFMVLDIQLTQDDASHVKTKTLTTKVLQQGYLEYKCYTSFLRDHEVDRVLIELKASTTVKEQESLLYLLYCYVYDHHIVYQQTKDYQRIERILRETKLYELDFVQYSVDVVALIKIYNDFGFDVHKKGLFEQFEEIRPESQVSLLEESKRMIYLPKPDLLSLYQSMGARSLPRASYSASTVNSLDDVVEAFKHLKVSK